MLQKNPLQPPRPFSAASGLPATSGAETASGSPALGRGFVTPEDFDATGILAGVDPSEPQYWWMPELHGGATAQAASPEPRQAACRSADVTVAAA
jgi:hypothetical protein